MGTELSSVNCGLHSEVYVLDVYVAAYTAFPRHEAQDVLISYLVWLVACGFSHSSKSYLLQILRECYTQPLRRTSLSLLWLVEPLELVQDYCRSLCCLVTFCGR